MDTLLALTATEGMAWRWLAQRDAELQRAYAALQADVRAINNEIEARLRLEPGSIGTTHRVDLDSGCVVEIEPNEA